MRRLTRTIKLQKEAGYFGTKGQVSGWKRQRQWTTRRKPCKNIWWFAFEGYFSGDMLIRRLTKRKGNAPFRFTVQTLPQTTNPNNHHRRSSASFLFGHWRTTNDAVATKKHNLKIVLKYLIICPQFLLILIS